MNEVLKNIYSRRSVRSYSDERLADDKIKEIIKAGQHAPNGMNVQALRFVVITNSKDLDRYGAIAKKMFIAGLDTQISNAPSEMVEGLQRLKSMLEKPDYNILHGAPCLVLIFAAPHALTPQEDGTLAAENMMLAAHSLGVGSCWIGFASTLGTSEDILKEMDVPSDHRLIAPLVFGYPKKVETSPSKRNDPVIMKWIR